MKKQFITPIILAFIVICSVSKGQINSIAPFQGTFSEGFENKTFGEYHSLNVFGNRGAIVPIDIFGSPRDTTIFVTHLSSFPPIYGGIGDVWPHSGSLFLDSGDGPTEWIFSTAAQKFGGYFTTNSSIYGATAKFYDINGSLLGTANVDAGPWKWNGWESTGAGIKRVQIIGNYGVGGIIKQDDMQFTLIPEPITLLLLGFGGFFLRNRK